MRFELLAHTVLSTQRLYFPVFHIRLVTNGRAKLSYILFTVLKLKFLVLGSYAIASLVWLDFICIYLHKNITLLPCHFIFLVGTAGRTQLA